MGNRKLQTSRMFIPDFISAKPMFYLSRGGGEKKLGCSIQRREELGEVCEINLT